MAQSASPTFGLRLGLLALGALSLVFAAIFAWPVSTKLGTDMPPPHVATALETRFTDTATQEALRTLKQTDPATYTTLETLAERVATNGTSPEALSPLVLEALFSQFRSQAYVLQFAPTSAYADIIARFSDGLERLEAADSAWCKGAQIAAFLTQNDSDLVPALLSQFEYTSPQYIWAMGFMTTVMEAAQTAQKAPIRHSRPTQLDEAILQQTGLNLGAEQWQLALQIAAFANTEGQGYGPMREIIAQIDVCQLGQAVDQVSSSLPEDVSARIWADLMPEIMVGNTPYAVARITDYFFIG